MANSRPHRKGYSGGRAAAEYNYMMRRPSDPMKKHPLNDPQLDVAWESRRRAFLGDLRTFIASRMPARAAWAIYFREPWSDERLSINTLLLSVLVHVLLFALPYPTVWRTAPQTADSEQEFPKMELTWYPARDLPPLASRAARTREPAAAPAVAPAEAPQPQPQIDAFHPRQTIVSTPLKPNHPRQALIQPDSPPEPPKILPALPNIVQWSEMAQPAKPRLQISKAVLAKLQPRHARRHARLPEAELPIPAGPNMEPQVGELNIASSALNNNQPRLAVAPLSVPQPGPKQVAAEAGPVPETGPPVLEGNNGSNDLKRLVALSANPAPPAPVLEVPPGNLAAHVSISPEGPREGSSNGGSGSGGAGAGAGGNTNGAGGGSGPLGITITHGDPNNSSTVVGPASAGLPRGPLPIKPEARPARAELGVSRPRADAPDPAVRSSLEGYNPASPPEIVLGEKRVYVLQIDMPNLTSATGSWILHFAELDPAVETKPEPGRVTPRLATNLAAPVPLRKVDPRYPPMLASARVGGEVVLYAIIRKDGSVDSIQVLRSVDPLLDRNAMEALARWKFRPAERSGAPVDLEAVVTIPFRPSAPL